MKRCLITGVHGSGASYLAEYLVARGDVEVQGITRWHTDRKTNLGLIHDKVKLFECDLTDMGAVIRALEEAQPHYIFHMASHANVRLCFVNPISIFNNNVNGTLNLLEAVRILKIKPVIQFCGCHDEKTTLLTNNGLKSYDRIDKNDMVLSINVNTNNVEWKPIKEIVCYDYDGPLHYFENKQLSQAITPNHNIIVDNSTTNDFSFIRSELLDETNRYVSRGNAFIGCQDTTIQVGNKTFDSKDLMYLIGLYIGDGYSSHSSYKIENKSGLCKKEYVHRKNKKGQFYSSKIKTGKINYTTCNSYRIFLAIPKKDKARKSAIECLTRMGIKFKEYDNEIYFSDKNFVEFFHTFGHKANEKRIPPWVFMYDASLLQFLLKGLIDSDGYYQKSVQRIYTVSDQLKDQILILGGLLSKNVSYVSRPPQKNWFKSKKRFINGNFIFYDITLSNRKKCINVKKRKEKNYIGKVWCLKIEDNHNFAVCRNGKVFFSGNTSEVYGQVRKEDTPIKETAIIDPVNVYAISKLAQEKLCKSYWLSYGIPVVLTRAFTYINPRRPDIFSSAFARQVVEVEIGERQKVIHGNLDSTRTIIDVRDIMEAYWLASQHCEWGEEYNIGGTDTLTVGEFLKELIKHAKGPIETELDPKLLRPVDVTMQIPDVTKFKQRTKWAPKYSLSDSIEFLLDHYRKNIR